MPDLPRRPFTLLPPPEEGSAGARERGLARKRRQAGVAAAAGLVLVGSVAGLGLASSTSAVDRLGPETFAGPTATATATGEPSADPTPAGPTPTPTAETTPTPAPASPSAAPGGGASDATPRPTGEPASGATGRSALARRYEPAPVGSGTVCGTRAGGPVGSPPAVRFGWCTLLEVVDGPDGGHDLRLKACRSSDAARADLHVDSGAVALRVEQEGTVVWRLPTQPDAAAVLPTDPGGCWVWTFTWDGRTDRGERLDPGQATAVGVSLSDELRDDEDSAVFTSGA